MITDFLISIVFNVVAFIVNIFAILPNVSLNSNITSNLSNIAPYYMGIEPVFPIGTLISILALELIFIGSYFTYKLIRWGYTKIPGIN